MDVLSVEFHRELINKLKLCIHRLTMRPGLFRGDYCDSFDGFLAGEAVSFLYVRDPGPLQDMLETDFIDVFLYESDIRNCFYFTSLETLELAQCEKGTKACYSIRAYRRRNSLTVFMSS